MCVTLQLQQSDGVFQGQILHLRRSQVLDFWPPHLTLEREVPIQNLPAELLLGEIAFQHEVALKL